MAEMNVLPGDSLKGRTELTGRMLKLAALFFMALDHISITMIERRILKDMVFYSSAAFLPGLSWKQWFLINRFLRCTGRLAFPIFVFCLVEGFCHTRNKKAYAARLFFFALLSEIPFDLAIFGQWYYPGHQNVMFTLLIGFLTLCAIEKYWQSPWMQLFFPALGYLGASLLRVDYGGMGVLMAVILYVYRGSKKQLMVGAVMAALESLSLYGTSALSFLLIWLYRGKEGRWPGKYFFYLAYPGHLLILSFVVRML